ncbi:MAG TPA: TIGR03435 family protein [Bryobacteraceae bacterium]
MKRTAALFLLSAGLAALVWAQRAGDLPPALVWDKLKGACPASLDWSSLRGNVVVVSFGDEDVFPNDIAEWNELPDKFQTEPVVFLRVVSGSEFLLDQALKGAAYRGCVLLDSGEANRRNFKIRALFGALVVDRFGYIAGYSGADGDDEQAILRTLNREKETGLLEQPRQVRPGVKPEAEPTPSYDVHISPSEPGELRWQGFPRAGSYLIRNQPLKLIIVDLWDTSPERIVFPQNLDPGNYDVTADLPEPDNDLVRDLLREAVERWFGLHVEKEMRTAPVFVLTAVQPSPQLRPSSEKEGIMTGGDENSMIGTNRTMKDIASILEQQTGAPVIDETRIEGNFSYSVSSNLRGPDAAFDFARQLGLRLEPAERSIEMLVVRK